MLNILKQSRIPITLGGKETYLVYNLNSRLYLESACPHFGKLMGAQAETLEATEILQLLKAGLIDSHFDENKGYLENNQLHLLEPQLSELGRVLGETDLQILMAEILEAFVRSMPLSPVGDTGEHSKKKLTI